MQAASQGRAEGHPGLQHRAAGQHRLQPQPGVLHVRCDADRGGRWRAGPRDGLVRQRVGLLQPHVRHRRAVRQPVTDAGSARSTGSTVAGKRVLLRADLNVPVRDGSITDLTRIERAVADDPRTVRQGRQGHRVQPFRPAEGQARARDVAARRWPRRWREVLGRPVAFAEDCIGELAAAGRRAHAQRRRAGAGEHPLPRRRGRTTRRSPPHWRSWPTSYVNDAFSAAHRAHASTEGVAHLLPSYAGRLMQAELEALDAALGTPGAPGRGHRRRRQGLHQARAARQSGRQGGRAGDRRRDGQHLPRRPGHRGRQVAAGSRDARDRARHPGARRGRRLRDRAADRCR